MTDPIQDVAAVVADVAKVETVVTSEVSAVETKVSEAKPIVQGWLEKLKTEGHVLYEDLAMFEQELVAKVESFLGKSSGNVTIAVPTAVVTAVDPNTPATPATPATTTTTV